MTGHGLRGILSAESRIATTWAGRFRIVLAILLTAGGLVCPPTSKSHGQELTVLPADQLKSFRWDFGRSTDPGYKKWPEGWTRYEGISYPRYVKAEIVAHDPQLAKRVQPIDTKVILAWPNVRRIAPKLAPLFPLTPPTFPDAWRLLVLPEIVSELLPRSPPSFSDAVIDRYFQIKLDGGQFGAASPMIDASRKYQYRFGCDIMTKNLRFDTARVELAFFPPATPNTGRRSKQPAKPPAPIAVYSTPAIGGTSRWSTLQLDLVRPPIGATRMQVRLLVDRSEDGEEDIRGTIGFDNIRINQYPQLQLTTNRPLGVYDSGESVVAKAKLMGVPANASRIHFQLFNHHDQLIASEHLNVQRLDPTRTLDSEVSWPIPQQQPGFYRISAALEGTRTETLATKTTVAVIDQAIGGIPHGSFGWTLPEGNQGIAPQDLADWLKSLGVAWVKYPCWLDHQDTEASELVTAIFSKLQDAGIQTIGILDVPPASQIPQFGLRGRRDMVAAQLFRDEETWQPLLEPVMSRLTLKVRTWQLGADRDHSFLGRPRLRDSISKISSGLQGFGQPIDIAVSWPWMELELPSSQSSWQAICRTSDPPLNAKELDAALTLSQMNRRPEGPRTWLLLDPISQSKYDRESRIRDLVLRMATVRNHRVQVAFLSQPRNPEHGLLLSNGRPAELLLPWRTTSRIIGDLRKAGSLQLRCGAQNAVFMDADRAVVMLWSAVPQEEKIYLGENIQSVDVWGKVTNLSVQSDPVQPHHLIKIGRLPIFIIGADPKLLTFRMSVALDNTKLDSLLGQDQRLAVRLAGPARESLVGRMRLMPPKAWRIATPLREWEALPGRTVQESFTVVLSNIAKIGEYELPIQFELETIPPKLLTVYRKVNVGPDGLELKATTRLLPGGEMRVLIELTNRSSRSQSYECMLWPPAKRQYKRRFITTAPGETVRREFFWPNGEELVGERMLLRAIEQNGKRVLNYSIDIIR